MKRDKPAIRAAMANDNGINFNADVHCLSFSQRSALYDVAKQHGYRKAVTSCLSLGAAFFQYLNKGV